MCFKVVIVKKKFAAGRLSKRFILEKLSKLPFTLLNYLSASRKGLFWKNFQATLHFVKLFYQPRQTRAKGIFWKNFQATLHFTLLNYLSASPN